MSLSWDDWAAHHAMLFCMLSKAETDVVKQWAALLKLRAWTPEEAYRASEHLAFKEPPAWRDKHLAALENVLAKQRLDESAKHRPEEEEHGLGTCTLCDSTGLVSVPNPRQSLASRGLLTCLVSCRCALGNWKAHHLRFRRSTPRGTVEERIQTLDEYELFYPHWKTQLENYRRYLRSLPKVSSMARELDTILGRLRKQQLNETSAGTKTEK